MGTKAWFIAYFDHDPRKALAGNPALDRTAARNLAERLLPGQVLADTGDGVLAALYPTKRQVFAGVYGGVRIVAHNDLAKDKPSEIDRRWFDPSLGEYAYVHATHSGVDWLAFGLWHEGRLVRSLSLNPDDGIFENIGEPLPFEAPYWDGKRPVEDYPLPFHPLDLSEAAMLHQLGFQFVGKDSEWVWDPYDVPIATFGLKRTSRFWPF
ncbi:DUF6928 family protein [Acuticoccus kandeliae]|uniref:DUF6928 family protein n=1 Tax=Acuticoccus kandeliae TaxID=2073160 RepID=UPI00196A32DA|nr:hypothetical protein [Acuticoccus kandeliae]